MEKVIWVRILNIGDAEFDATISGNQFVLVDFWAPWCGPCKMIGPVLDQISSERDDVQIVKVNTDTDSMSMTKLGVRGIPALFMFKDGKVVGNLSEQNRKLNFPTGLTSTSLLTTSKAGWIFSIPGQNRLL